MKINFETTVKGDSGINEMISRLKQLDNQKVSAGIFGGFAQKKAMWNEYGTSRMPSRPFLRNTMYEHSSEWATFLKPKISAVMNGASPDSVMSSLGPKMMSDIKQTIDSGNFAALAPSTIAKKGSSKPLIDTGDMYSSITWRKG